MKTTEIDPTKTITQDSDLDFLMSYLCDDGWKFEAGCPIYPEEFHAFQIMKKHKDVEYRFIATISHPGQFIYRLNITEFIEMPIFMSEDGIDPAPYSAPFHEDYIEKTIDISKRDITIDYISKKLSRDVFTDMVIRAQ